MESKQVIINYFKSIPQIHEIIDHDLFLTMAAYNHHGSISCLEHTLNVAYRAYTMCCNKTDIDMISTVRAALLHDFYLYDWHTNGQHLHGFSHPYTALRNAEKYFSLNKIERNAIKRHMFPLTPIPPRYKESFIVTLADKVATIDDYTWWKKSEPLCKSISS